MNNTIFRQWLNSPAGRFNYRNHIALRSLFAAAALMLLTSCTSTSPGDAMAKDDTQKAAATPSAAAENLAGTAWQLVNIMSMDDHEYTPAERSSYTLTFENDGRLLVRADCNRGQGTWTSGTPGQLEFGPLAMTRAMCPPESLHDRFVSNMEYVRSYVFKDGHLFLATMADGAIIEFEPLAP